jgi:RNA-binding protein
MHRVGTVERIAQGVAVARAADDDDLPESGQEVVDESLDVVGRVVSVFGPVDQPYVAVAPDERDPATLFDEALYAR